MKPELVRVMCKSNLLYLKLSLDFITLAVLAHNVDFAVQNSFDPIIGTNSRSR